VQKSVSDDVSLVAQIEAVQMILEVVCRTTGMGFAAVARVTKDRWIACAVRDEIAFGLEPGGELEVTTTICDEIRDSGRAVIIDHVAEDEAFCGHPTPQMYGFQSYISVPIRRRDGRFFGKLCAIDPRPARLKTPETTGMFTLFADLIGFHLDAQERLASSEAELIDERQTAELRERFVAVLGHELRNPLSAIDSGAKLLSKRTLDATGRDIVALIQGSVSRMAELVENVLDFARTRGGAGVVTDRAIDAGLESMLRQVIAELCTAYPDRVIESDIALTAPVACNSARIAQLFSNLLANALIHGDPVAPVRVRAASDDSIFELSIANEGKPIPADLTSRLFQPFTRDSLRPGGQGLGLGLFIASEIARAHQGTLEVNSTPRETRFTFRMPVAAAREAQAPNIGRIRP